MNKYYTFILAGLLSISSSADASAKEKQRKAQQEKLDLACAQAREKKIAPLRKEIVKECVDSGRTKKYCEDFNKDYGAKMGNRAPLFMDLPECVEAFEYKRSYRSSR